MRRTLLLPVIAAMLSAESYPSPGLLDPHIQHVPYEPDQVVVMRGALGWQIMIEFGEDERIENVSIGDSLAWQVTPNKRAKLLFLKPLLRDGTTNMTVVTTKRRYTFALATGPRARTTPWVLRFDYPPPPVQVVVEARPAAPAIFYYGYTKQGSAAVLPNRVWDDGRQTYFEFAANTPIPAIFAWGPGKKDEALVNVATRGRTQVVQQLGRRFILRLGNSVGTVTRAPEP